MKWVPYVVVLLIILAVYLTSGSLVKDEHADRSMVKKIRSNANSVMREDARNKNKKSKERATASEPSTVVPSTTMLLEDSPLDPLSNPYLEKTKTRAEKAKNIFNSISSEKRESLDLQLVGDGKWSIFSNLQVSRDPIHNTLFAVGPYHVSRKEDRVSGTPMGLIIEENQKFLGILTGRIVIKVHDLYDMDPLAKDYGLKVDNISAEIRTAYVDASHVGGFARLNQTLKADQRIERFYFEVVKTDWVKN